MQKITVSSNEAGQRLDKLLGKYLSNAPMSFVYKMLRKKNIKLNGKKAQGNEKLTKGDQVEVFLSDDTWQKFAGAPGAEKQLPADLARAMESSIRLSVIYEDPPSLRSIPCCLRGLWQRRKLPSGLFSVPSLRPWARSSSNAATSGRFWESGPT